MSSCAIDHYTTVVKNLTEEQLDQRYPLACIERWGDLSDRRFGPTSHGDEDDDESDEDIPKGTVPLRYCIDQYEGCRACGSDGTQFFSFCLNRPVNDNMVHHCEWCHRCFYFQPGCLRGCSHCGKGYFSLCGGDEDDIEYQLAKATGTTLKEAEERILEAGGAWHLEVTFVPEWRGTNVPRDAAGFARGLANEGFWGW